ncbi:hypothetical protein OROHE_021402 [Orobanche hederae]
MPEGQGGRRRQPSGWWGNILAAVRREVGDWFFKNLKRSVGNGGNTSFWHARWCGEQPLKLRFPRLFTLSAAKEGLIGEMGRWENGGWNCDFNWRRMLNDRERGWVENMADELLRQPLSECRTDRWLWGQKADGVFNVKEAYAAISNIHELDGGVRGKESRAAAVWNSSAPFKQQLFAWRVIRNRIPTRDNLAKRMELSVEGRLIPCCEQTPETATHLILRCAEMEALWNRMVDWIGISWAVPVELFDHFTYFSSALGNDKYKKRLRGLWICVAWMIWRWRIRWYSKTGNGIFREWKRIFDAAFGVGRFIGWSKEKLCKSWDCM